MPAEAADKAMPPPSHPSPGHNSPDIKGPTHPAALALAQRRSRGAAVSRQVSELARLEEWKQMSQEAPLFLPSPHSRKSSPSYMEGNDSLFIHRSKEISQLPSWFERVSVYLIFYR